MVDAETLQGYPYFQWASPDTLATLSMVCEEIRFEVGSELFKQGEPADFLYVITRGEVEIQYPVASGERRTVDRLGQGDLMAWSAVVEPYVNTSFGVAKTGGQAVRIDALRLRQLIEEDPGFSSSMMTEIVQVIAGRLKGARKQLAESR